MSEHLLLEELWTHSKRLVGAKGEELSIHTVDDAQSPSKIMPPGVP